ncbi:hypothetical protein A8C32_10065 [Flavivirga aquatica]|uniref:Uncharacterized protein n=1 Tax=Flavivirga aquatica TaxID=1849968 RepID=A0A1E5TES6_9FLAO|nr:hypothetical protein [Flavivirga aquatica]OEK09847.1 hypothetical protein A8C32_10065 [Flavivirga aquatica]
MWNKLLERLETAFEPQFDDVQFVSHDDSFLTYKKTKEPISYSFTIEEETLINGVKTHNIYKQLVSIEFVSKDPQNRFVFNVEVLDSEYELDKRLTKQQLLVSQLTELTNKISFEIDVKGHIRKLLNYKEIQEKWERLEIELKRRHIGKLSHAYIDAIGEKINNQGVFTSDFSQYRLFGFLFNGLLQLSGDSGRPSQRKRVFKNYINYLPLRVDESITFLEENEDTKELKYKIGGDLIPLQGEEAKKLASYFDYYHFQEKTLFLKAYNGEYVLDKHTAMIKNGRLTIHLTNNNEYTRTMKIHLKQINYGS